MAESVQNIDIHDLPEDEQIAPNDISMRADRGIVATLPGGIRIRHIDSDAPTHWVAAGWEDMKKTMGLSLFVGGVFAAMAYVILIGLELLGLGSMAPVMVGGFALVAPFLALPFYEASRRLEAGLPVGPDILRLDKYPELSQLGLIGIALMMLFLTWFLAARMIFALFYSSSLPRLGAFLSDLWVSEQWPYFLVVGTAAGAAIASVAFAMAAISLPMLLDRRVSAFVAVWASIEAVQRNKAVMIGWAATIAFFTFSGAAAAFVGLALTVPVIGHATWHAYRGLVEAPEQREIQPFGAPRPELLSDGGGI